MKALFHAALLIVALPVAHAGTVLYTYDAAGRLQQATFEHTGGFCSYAMDAAGNVTERHTAPVPEPVWICGAAACAVCLWRRRTRAGC